MAKRQDPLTPEKMQEIAARFLAAKTSLDNAKSAKDQADEKLATMTKQLELAKQEYDDLIERMKNGD